MGLLICLICKIRVRLKTEKARITASPFPVKKFNYKYYEKHTFNIIYYAYEKLCPSVQRAVAQQFDGALR